ncbi:MAG: restriction endonuclease subunit S, partial [Planctomycetales bacterium]|nr:restriction endonuclease subunit S [Planctomycetales bacterium]
MTRSRSIPAITSSGAPSAALPNGWRWHRLGDATEISSGITLGRNLNGRECRVVPYLRVANVQDGFLDLDDVKKTPASEDEINACRLEPGDVLLTEGGDLDKLGRGTYWQGEIPDCIHQNHIFRIRFDPALFDSAFLAFQFGSPYGKAYFLRHAKRTTGIASINKAVLSNFPLLAPPFAEQRRIAARLR